MLAVRRSLASLEYRGTITGLQFDPVKTGREGEWVKVRSITFHKLDAG